MLFVLFSSVPPTVLIIVTLLEKGSTWIGRESEHSAAISITSRVISEKTWILIDHLIYFLNLQSLLLSLLPHHAIARIILPTHGV